MNKRWEVILAGSGGQGLVMAGVILAQAAVFFEGKNAVQTQSYGIQSRGGYSQAEVIISTAEIIHPKTVHPDIILALTQESYDKNNHKIFPETLLLYDMDNIKITCDNHNSIPLPLTVLARKLGNLKTLNSIALGAIVGKTKIVSLTALEKALKNNLEEKVLEINREAIHLGASLGFPFLYK